MREHTEQHDTDSLRTEYSEIGNNLRFYADARFKQLNLFVSLTAALAAGALQFSQVEGLGAAAGICIAFIFLVFDFRYVSYWQGFHERGRQIDSILGLGQYSSLPPRGIITATHATRLLYASSIPFWATILAI